MFIVDFLRRRKNPIRYWRNKGAVIGNNCEIYSSASFGSEPYLVEIGNHVRVNSGVQFVTHDGGCGYSELNLNMQKLICLARLKSVIMFILVLTL